MAHHASSHMGGPRLQLHEDPTVKEKEKERAKIRGKEKERVKATHRINPTADTS